jgi:hypothetical protein
MMTRAERIASRLAIEAFDDVRTAYINRALAETGHIESARKWMADNGYDRIVVGDGDVATADGREVVRAFGWSWALRPDVLSERARVALDVARAQAEERKVVERHEAAVTEGIALVTCPQMSGGRPCGGTLNMAPVCPSCVTGRMGYKYRYTCESCGCDIVTRGELK